MCGQRGEVDIHFIDVERDLTCGLHCIRMEQDATLTSDLADLLDLLNDADFIVGRHDRDQNRFSRDGLAQIIKVHHSFSVHGQERNPESLLLQVLARVEYGLVFGHTRDDVVSLFPVHPGRAFNRQVVRLGRATRENDFTWIGADQSRYLLSSLFDGFLGFPTELVISARGIAKLVRKERHHGVEHTRIHRGRRMIVHVNRQLHHFVSSLIS